MTRRTRKRYPCEEEVRRVLGYCPETGRFWWLEDVSRKCKAGDTAGTIRPDGYRQLRLDGVLVLGSHVAWFMNYGEWPPSGYDVDHKDRNTSNDAKDNLRLATRTQNNANAKRPRHNTSGYKGASYDKRRDKWEACINYKGRKRFLGYFDSPEEAHAAYCKAANDLHGEFARTA